MSDLSESDVRRALRKRADARWQCLVCLVLTVIAVASKAGLVVLVPLVIAVVAGARWNHWATVVKTYELTR